MSGLDATLARGSARAHGAALRFERDGSWQEMSYAELDRAVDEVAGGLAAIGIEPGDRVAILADTRPEWTIADLGALRAAAVVVPIYPTNSPEECRYVLEHSGARLVFCENAEQVAKVEEVRDACPELQWVVAFAGGGPGATSLAELRRSGAETGPPDRAAAIDEDGAATIVYTSGTTGPPKGCVLTHASVRSTVDMYGDSLELGSKPFSVYFFLPLAHALARIVQMVVLDRGGTLVYWRRDPKLILDDLAAVKPTHFPSVPRVFEKAHNGILAKAEGRDPRSLLLRWALGVGARMRAAEREGGPGALLRRQHALADRLALSKVRELFGGRLEMAVTGAAPVSREVLELFEACGIPVLEGYGLTESCAAATLNTPSAVRLGTVGRALPGVEVETAPDGEVLIRGANVFSGYHRNEEATRETIENGWLLTGDLGSIDEGGYLTITGRKKELIITSGGKNVSPTNIETLLRERAWISQAVVYGDNRPYLVALLTLDPDDLPALAERIGAPADPAELARDERARALLQAEVDEVNRRLARVEQIKRFDVLDHDLAQETGELTPTMKLKRAVIGERHRERFDRLYE